MGHKALHLLLWLLPVLTLTTQELVLEVSPRVSAECGKRVTLNCRVSSSQNGLSVIKMQWYQDGTPLCSENKGNLTIHQKQSLSNFHCEYEYGQLSLVFHEVQPMDIREKFMCKLRSNQGADQKYSMVELQECCGNVTGSLEREGNRHICIFKHVHPDGDVHWFHGSHSYSSGPHVDTSKQVEKGGWLTIHSSLRLKGSDRAFNCSLVSTDSGRYIASYSFQNPKVMGCRSGTNGVESKGPMRTFLFVSILLGVSLK